MASKVKIIKTVTGDVFEISDTRLINVIRGEIRRSVSRKDVAKFFAKPHTGNYFDYGTNPQITVTHNKAYTDLANQPTNYAITFDIFIDNRRHFNIGCMEFSPAATTIIRRWAKSSTKSNKVVTPSRKRKVA